MSLTNALQKEDSFPKPKVQFRSLVLLVGCILAVFVIRTLLAASFGDSVPRLFDLFDSLTVCGALIVLLRGYGSLRLSDWLAALGLAVIVGASLPFATLFSPYPLFDVVRSPAGQAVQRGLFTFVAALGGLAVMRQDGPVLFHAARSDWRKVAGGLLAGLVAGLPLAVLNVFALQLTEGQAVRWQSPGAALLDALQPGIVEEVIYRFALWGMLWLLLRKSLPRQSAALAGLVAMLVHNFAHFSDLFVQSPLTALGIGLVLALFWGLPPFFLARKKGLESAIAFHWIQDAARFLTGF